MLPPSPVHGRELARAERARVSQAGTESPVVSLAPCAMSLCRLPGRIKRQPRALWPQNPRGTWCRAQPSWSCAVLVSERHPGGKAVAGRKDGALALRTPPRSVCREGPTVPTLFSLSTDPPLSRRHKSENTRDLCDLRRPLTWSRGWRAAQRGVTSSAEALWADGAARTCGPSPFQVRM